MPIEMPAAAAASHAPAMPGLAAGRASSCLLDRDRRATAKTTLWRVLDADAWRSFSSGGGLY